MNTLGQWRDLNCSIPTHPWVKAFNDRICTSPLPNLSGKEIVIATDSSGLHRQNPFDILGLLIFDFDASIRWEVLRQSIRREILRDARRMSFKKLDEPVRQRALIPFLLAADQINGLCLSVAVNKRIDLLGGTALILEQLKSEGILQAKWSLESFRRMARMTTFVSFLIAGLCAEGQNICWISDEDEMFESPEKSKDTLRLLSSFLKMYVSWPLGKLSAGTTKLDQAEGDRFSEDFTAIADIAAGAFGELVMKLRKDMKGCIIDATTVDFLTEHSDKSNLLLTWLSDNTHQLKRISVVFDCRDDGKFRVAKFGFG
jgi:hypothetical protein